MLESTTRVISFERVHLSLKHFSILETGLSFCLHCVKGCLYCVKGCRVQSEMYYAYIFNYLMEGKFRLIPILILI